MSFEPIILSVKLSLITSFILFFISLPIAYFLSNTKTKAKILIEAIVTVPLVLPPSVIGFYLLIFLSPNSAFGGVLDKFGISLVFNFSALVVASCVYSLPFMVAPLQNALEALPKNLKEASLTLGKGRLVTLFYVLLPNIKTSILSAFIITFAHTLGEFGVVLIIGGSIEGQTRLASIAIYELIENFEYEKAHVYSAVLLFISFCVVFVAKILEKKQKNATSLY